MRCAPKTDCSDGLEATGGLDDIDPRLCASSELLLLLEDFHNFDPGTWAMVGAARDWTGDSWNCLLGAAGGSAAAASATSEDANVQYIVAAAAAAAAAISIGDASAAAEADRPEPAASQQIGNAASAEAARWQQFGLWAAQYRVSSAQALSMGARSIGVPAAAAAAAAIAAGAAGAATTLALAPLTLAPLTLILTGRGFVQAPPLEYVALKFNDPCVQQLPLRNMKPADIVAVTAAFLGVRTMPSTSLETPKQERYRRSLQGSRVRTGISVGHELNSPHSPTSPSHALQHSSTHVSWGSGQAARVRAQTRARNRKNTDSNNAGDSAEVAVADISTSLVALSRSACGSPALVRNVHEQQHDTRPRSFSMGGSKGDLGSPALSRTQSQSFSSNTKSASKMNSSGTNNDAHKLPRELVRFIVAKAEGNPRWATELALAALSAGAIRITRRRQRRHSSGGETAATSASNSSTSAQNDIQILMAPEHVGAGTSDRGIRTPATPGGRTPGGSRRLAPRTPGGSRVSQLDGPVRLEDVPLLQQTLSSLFRSLVVEQLSPSVQLTLKVAAVVNVTGQFSLPVLYAVHPLRNEARSRRRARRQQMRLLQSVYRQRSTSNGVDSEDTGDDSDDEGSSTDEGSGSDADADIDTSFTAGVVGGGHGAATAAFGGNTSLPLAGVEGAIYADVIELERRRLVRESVSLSSKGEGSDNEDGGNGEGNDGNAGSAGLGPSDRIAPSLLGRGSRLRRLHESDAARFGQGLDAMGDIFEFVNDSLRQGVYDLLSLEQRRRFHGAIARHHIRACASSPQAMERLAAMAAAFGEKWTLVGLGLGVEPWNDCDGSDSSHSEANANAGQNAALAEPNFQMKAVNYVLSQRVECDGRFSGWYRCREAELQRALDLVLIARATARQDAEAMAAVLLRDSSFAAGGSGGGDCDSHKSQSNSAISTNDGNGKANEPVEGSVAPSESALPPLSESTVLRRRRSSSDLGAPPPLHTAAPGASMAFLSVDTRRAPIPSNAARQRRLPDDSPLSPTSPPAAPSLMLKQSPAEIRRTVAPASADHDVSGPGAHVVQSGGRLSSAKSLGVRRFADATSGANKNVALAGAPAASPYLRRLRSDGDVPVDSAAGESNGQARTIVRRQRSEGDSAEPRDPGIVEHTVNDAEATRTGDLTVDEKRDQRRRVSAPEQRLLATLRHEDSMSLRRRLSAREAALVRAAVPRVQARLAMAAETDDVLETGDGKQRVSAMNIGKARAFGDRLTQRDRRHSISSLSSLAGVAGDDVVGADPLSGKRLTRADSIAPDLLCEAQPTTDWRHDSPRPKTSRNRSMRQRTIFSGGFSPRPGSPFGKNRSASSTKAAEIFSALLPEDHPENAEGGESQAPRRNSRSNRTGDRQNRDSIQSGRSDSIVSVASVNSVNSVASAMSSDADAPSLALNATSPNIKPSSPSQSKAGTGIQKLWKGIESGTNVQSHSDTSVRDQRIGDAKSSVIEPTSAQSKGAHDEMSSVSSEGERDVLGESDVEADEEISSAISAEALEQQQQQQQATPARLKRSLGRKVSFKEDTETARNLVSEDSNDTSAADNDVLSSDDEDHDDDEDEDDDDALARTEAGRAMQVHAMARA
eukprot:g890.t1